MGLFKLESCFFVGDAAGRRASAAHLRPDHSDCDLYSRFHHIFNRIFALNIGIPFYVPNEYFNAAEPRRFSSSLTKKLFALKKRLCPSITPISSHIPNTLAEGNSICIVVGQRSSGKTFIAKEYFSTHSYHYFVSVFMFLSYA